MSCAKGADKATKLCGNRFEPTWAPGQERTVYGWVADEDDRERGLHRGRVHGEPGRQHEDDRKDTRARRGLRPGGTAERGSP
jgi:hypothetical protein